jgi:hypothetical protein
MRSRSALLACNLCCDKDAEYQSVWGIHMQIKKSNEGGAKEDEGIGIMKIRKIR